MGTTISQALIYVRLPIETDFQTKFGQRIRELRTAKGYSQEKLAEKAGLHWTYVGQIERGGRNPTLKNILKLSKALDMSPSDLFSYEI
jgi:transcriptional regulator with XRE-family HTH domain